MQRHTRIRLVLFVCLTISFASYTVAQVDPEAPTADYIFQTIEVPGVDFLEVTSSNDLELYAGNTKNPDDDKIIGFTRIDGVFSTYDVEGGSERHRDLAKHNK